MLRALFYCLVAFAVTVLSAFDIQTAYEQDLAKHQSKQSHEALAPAEEAVREDGGKAASVHLYGLILAALQRLDGAEENLRKAAALAPDQAAFQYDLGFLLHQHRKYVEAQRILQR